MNVIGGEHLTRTKPRGSISPNGPTGCRGRTCGTLRSGRELGSTPVVRNPTLDNALVDRAVRTPTTITPAERFFRSAATMATRAAACRSSLRSSAGCCQDSATGLDPHGRHSDGVYMAVFDVTRLRDIEAFRPSVGDSSPSQADSQGRCVRRDPLAGELESRFEPNGPVMGKRGCRHVAGASTALKATWV